MTETKILETAPRKDPAERSGYLRYFYRNWRPTLFGRTWSKSYAFVAGLGLTPQTLIALQTHYGANNRLSSTVLVAALHEGQRYLVSMLGEDSYWVRNVRAKGGKAFIKRGKSYPVILKELPPSERAPILKAWCKLATSGRNHLPISFEAPVSAFEAIAADYPVFRIEPSTPSELAQKSAAAPAKWGVIGGICAMALAMLLGPLVSPEQFSVLHHSTSEQAAQHLSGAWIIRVGFLAYGASVVASSAIDWRTRPWVRVALAMFGLGLIGTAIWSNAPIIEGVPADLGEDQMHSIASGVVGLAFALACAARLFSPGGNRKDLLAWSGLVVSVAIPVAMTEFSGIRGLLQRGMFVFSFAFILREFLGSFWRRSEYR